MALAAGIKTWWHRLLCASCLVWTLALACEDSRCSTLVDEGSSLIQLAPRVPAVSSSGKMLASSVACSNGQSIEPTADVVLTGHTVSCEFRGVEMFASIKLQDGASVTLSGGCRIHGSVECFECGRVKLLSAEVLGSVVVTRGQSLDVSADVFLSGGLSVQGPGTEYVHVDGSAASMQVYRPNITSISADEPGDLHIRHANVVAGVSVSGSTQVVIDQAMVGGEVRVGASAHRGGVVIGATKMGSLTIMGAGGDINVGQQSEIAKGFLVNGGDGEVHIFDSSVAGVLRISERKGRVLLADSPSVANGVKIEKCSGDVIATGLAVANGAFSVSGCKGDCDVRVTASFIDQGIFVQSGKGIISILQVSMPSGDLTVLDRQANAKEADVALLIHNSIVNDVLMARIEGSVESANVSAHSGMTVTQLKGKLTLMDSVVQGDFKLIVAHQITGRVEIVGALDLSLILTENQGDILLRGNNINNLGLTKNTGKIELIDNTIEILMCADNTFEPVIQPGNSFLELVVGRPQSGQCSRRP